MVEVIVEVIKAFFGGDQVVEYHAWEFGIRGFCIALGAYWLGFFLGRLIEIEKARKEHYEEG